MNRQADDRPEELRLSIDTKAAVKIGEFSRGGYSWVQVQALDHDYQPDAVLVPVGILIPKYDELWVYFVPQRVTADALVDVLDLFWKRNKRRFAGVTRLVLNQDNGPENNSRRTQFMQRIVGFADKHETAIRLAYYPPYHSKYNPVERCWAVLENEWSGDLLDSVEAALGHASSMTWKGNHPEVRLIHRVYEKGKSLCKKAMATIEARIRRFAGLEKWFIDIEPQAA